jgi:phosphotransferase system HPr-like phosphotransfer protein
MKSVNIKLVTIADIQKFVGLLAKHISVDIDLKSGRYTVDARSIIGVFTLDLNSPLELIVQSTDDAVVNAVLDDVKEWIV